MLFDPQQVLANYQYKFEGCPRHVAYLLQRKALIFVPILESPAGFPESE